jgi:hypothetical protein
MERKLDREVRFDERSRNYPISAILKTTKLKNKIWKCEEHLDQGSEGACVGYAWTHELNAVPYVIPVTNNTAKTVYYAAQQWDEWAGTNYEGTSVIAGAKTISSLGFVSEYRWAFGIDDVVQTLSNHGPVVLGINWYSGMFNTDINGFIKPTGTLAGGHAILANGIQVREKDGWFWKMLPDPIIRLHNSWGTSWGVNGDAFIYASDLSKLLKQNGEACVPVERNRY